jgi:hypothetical protein
MKNTIKSLSLFACSALVVGCAASSEDNTMAIDELGASSFQSESAIRMDRTSEGTSMSFVGGNWTQAEPGIFQSGEQRLVVGLEGHRAAIAQGEKNLQALQQSGASESMLQQSESSLNLLKNAAANLKDSDPSTQATCNIGFILGPSSPFTGIVGAIAATQISCSIGVQTFTVQTQACTNFGCSAVFTGTNTVGTVPWTFGVVRTGTAGAACAAAALVTPPSLLGQWNGACG